MVFATKEQLSEALQTSPNNVDKIKWRLKEIGLIDFERKQQVKKTVKPKIAKGVRKNATSNII